MFFFWQHNSDDRPPPNKFLSIQAIPTSSFRPGFPPGGITGSSGLHSRSTSNDAHMGASDTGFGSFGTGVGIGGQTWKAAGSKKP